MSEMADLLRVLGFAAEKHRAQRRKNAAADPYINHPIAVAELLAREGAVTDFATLAAALLHDTVEDTATTEAELTTQFGARIADLVMAVSDDKTLPKATRKQLQIDHAPTLDPAAKLVKLADKICNLSDVLHQPPKDWDRARRQEYADWCARVVAGLRGCNPALEAKFAALYAESQAFFAEERRGSGDSSTNPP